LVSIRQYGKKSLMTQTSEMEARLTQGSASSRIGGLFLLVAGTSLPVIIIDYINTMSGLVGANGAPTIPERVSFAATVFEHLQIGWHAEVVAMALLGAGALSLLGRGSRSGWALCAMGCVVAMPMYAVMVGGYGGVFSQSNVNVELFQVLNGMANFSFLIGQGLVHLGLGIAFLLEDREDLTLLPRWVLLLGAATNLLTGVVFILNHIGMLESFLLAGPFGLLGHLLVAAFGFRLLALRST
jgi:hypothetical protein